MWIAAMISRRSRAIGWRRAIIWIAALLDLLLQLVDALVAGDDALGERGVAVDQRGHRIGNVLLGKAAHLGDLAGKVAQLVVERGNGVFRHGRALRVASQPKRPVM